MWHCAETSFWDLLVWINQLMRNHSSNDQNMLMYSKPLDSFCSINIDISLVYNSSFIGKSKNTAEAHCFLNKEHKFTELVLIPIKGYFLKLNY